MSKTRRVSVYNIQTDKTTVYDAGVEFSRLVDVDVTTIINTSIKKGKTARRLVHATYLVWYTDYEEKPEIDYSGIYLLYNDKYPDIVWRTNRLAKFIKERDIDTYSNRNKRGTLFTNIREANEWYEFIDGWCILYYPKHVDEYDLKETILYVVGYESKKVTKGVRKNVKIKIRNAADNKVYEFDSLRAATLAIEGISMATLSKYTKMNRKGALLSGGHELIDFSK